MKSRLLSPAERVRVQVMRRRNRADKNAFRRAKLMGVRAEHVDSDVIRQRDRETCHLCGRWVSVWDASLDHVDPLSKGGAHTYDNIRLAHAVCNSKKSDRLMSELDLSTF